MFYCFSKCLYHTMILVTIEVSLTIKLIEFIYGSQIVIVSDSYLNCLYSYRNTANA